MAAVTSTLVALGGVGVSAAQAIKAQSQMKQATQASALAKQQLKQIKETNPFKAVQTPMLGFELAQQQQSQREAQMVGALEGAGAEGIIGGIGQVAQAGNEQDLQLAAQANQTQFQRDMAQAQAESGIEARKAERDFTVGLGEIQEQNMRRYEAASNRNAAIAGALGFAGDIAGNLDDMIGLYGKKKSGVTTGAGGGINWDYMYGNKANIPGLQQPTNIVTGSNINNPNAVLGNQGNQVVFP
jgi:hypothetical protein